MTQVTTWNMNHCFKSEKLAEAWDWLDALGADVAFLQESPPPPDHAEALYEQVAFPGRTDWGARVLGLLALPPSRGSASGR